MSCYIKQAITYSKALAYYIGNTRRCAEIERGDPKNQLISNFEKEHGKISWKLVLVISENETHPEFGESFLINCFKQKLNQLTLLNKNIPNIMALTYDKKSESIIDKFSRLIV